MALANNQWDYQYREILVVDRYPEGEMDVKKKRHIDLIFTDLRGRVFRGLNRKLFSR